MPFVNMWSVLPFQQCLCQSWWTVMKCHLSKGGLSCQSWNEFSNAYSQNKSAEMPLVQKESNPTCPSQTPLVEEGVHRRCSQMPFAVRYVSKNYQIEIRTIQSYILPWATIRPRQQRTTNFQQTYSLFDPSLFEMGADGDLVEEVEMDPHIAERGRSCRN
jgi:hypothetical protein